MRLGLEVDERGDLTLGRGQMPSPSTQRLAPCCRQGKTWSASSWALLLVQVAKCIGTTTLAWEGQVAGYPRRFSRQGLGGQPCAPPIEDAPLGGIDPAGVLGEEGTQGGRQSLSGCPKIGFEEDGRRIVGHDRLFPEHNPIRSKVPNKGNPVLTTGQAKCTLVSRHRTLSTQDLTL